MIKLNKTKKEIESFKAFQEIWKQKEREELEEETKRIAEFLKQKEKQQKERYLQTYINLCTHLFFQSFNF